jgi:hypothetical protein
MRPDELFNLLLPYKYELAHFWQTDLWLELYFWVVVFLVTVALLMLRPAAVHKAELLCKRVGRRKGLAVAVCIFSALSIRVALLPILPLPEPIVHDEYSYLLQAETFASGRLTNPTPTMWVHFESFHINMRPTYQSMYPPAQALPMAAALALHLHPWWGEWLTVGLMCGAVCWMLQGWMPPQWAFLGGMYCVFRFATFSYWMNSYWGGQVAAIAAALVLGSLPRIKRSPRLRYTLLFALGLAILANSRPYEGLVFTIPALVVLLLWLLGVGRKEPIHFASFAPAVALLVLVAAGMGYYNWRSTGNPLFMPYAANHQQYHITKPFLWQKPNPIPHYHHQVMRTMYVYHELPDLLNRRYADGLWNLLKLKFGVFYDFFIWPLFALTFVSGWAMFKSRRMWIMPLTLVVLWGGLFIEQWPPNPHYGAPFVCVVTAIVLYGLRLLRLWKPRGLPVGYTVGTAVMVTFAVGTAVPLVCTILNPYGIGVYWRMPPTLDRSRLQAQLEQKEGQHLIIVHNNRSALGIFDWVYNQPDIDNSKVIWARDMGPAANQELINFYPHRHAWYVDQDDGLMRLTPYDQEDQELDPARTLHVATNRPLTTGR